MKKFMRTNKLTYRQTNTRKGQKLYASNLLMRGIKKNAVFGRVKPVPKYPKFHGTQRMNPFENNMGKGKNVDNLQFFFFSSNIF